MFVFSTLRERAMLRAKRPALIPGVLQHAPLVLKLSAPLLAAYLVMAQSSWAQIGPGQPSEPTQPGTAPVILRAVAPGSHAEGTFTATTTATIPTLASTLASTTTAAATVTATCPLAWSLMPSPNVATSGHPFSGVAAISTNNIWAVGSYGTNSDSSVTLIEHWDGFSWSMVPSSHPGSYSSLSGVTAVSANDIWAVGYYGSSPGASVTLIEHWNGISWNIVPSPTPVTIYSAVLSGVAAVSANDIWAVGNYSDSPNTYWTLIEHWDGRSWTIVSGPDPGSRSALYAVAAVSAHDIWAVGSYYPAGSPGTYVALIEHWDGRNWTLVPGPDPGTSSSSGLYGITAVSANDIWAVGDLVEHWDGRIWSIAPGGNTLRGLQGVAALSANDIWAVGYIWNWYPRQYEIRIEHWDGTAWTVVPVHDPGQLYSVAAVAGNDVWAGGGNMYHWDGSTWRVVSSPATGTASNQLNGVAAVSASDIWAVGDYSSSPVPRVTLIEHWDGSTWSVVPSPSLGESTLLYDVAAVSANDVWTVGGWYTGYSSFTAHPVVEHWDGSSWSMVPSPDPGSYDVLSGVAAVSANDVWAVGFQGFSGSLGPTLIEHWDGSTWSVVPSPHPGSYSPLSGVTAVSANDIWAVGYYGDSPGPGSTLIEHWDGSTWSVVPSPNPGSASNVRLNGVAAVVADDVWAVGADFSNPNSSATLTEHWNGSTWSIVPNPGTETLNRVAAVSTNNVWAVGYSGPYPSTQPLVEHWDGQVWSIVSNPGTGTLNGVAAVSANDVWAVGETASGVGLIERYSDFPFYDVHPSDYFYEAVHNLYCRGVISGYSDSTFRPGNLTTRGQFGKVIVLAQSWLIYTPPTPTFRDVPTTHAFYTYIETAYSHGVVSGYDCGTNCLEFRPGNNVTRGQVCKVVALAEGWPTYTPPTPTFRDVPATHAFYSYIETAYNKGIISGYTCGAGCLEFKPGNNATRGQLSKIVYNAIIQP
ncbi:MAG: S-layer homology domain-containing protein [Chloroflexia bacterium]